MPAELVKVLPPALLQAAASAAAITEQAAAVSPGVVPVATPGTPADSAWSGVAAGMGTRAGQLSGKLAGKGPQVQTTTQTGVAALQGADQQNAEDIRALPADARSGAGVQSAGFGTGGAPPLSPTPPNPVPPKFPLSYTDIITKPVGAPGPYGYQQIAPGTWVPDPAANGILFTPSPNATTWVDLADLRPITPGAPLQYGEKEFLPGWALPDPSAPNIAPHPPKFPLDLAKIMIVSPEELLPFGYLRLTPTLAVPDPSFGPPR